MRYGRIGFYLPFEGEMDMLPLLNQALRLGKSCYLPVVPRRFQKHLYFTRLTARPSWYLNRFGIHEHWSPRPVRASQLDLLFMPLVGFDKGGFRLGMGGGFYDTSLAFLGRRKIWRKPYLVGIGYECQKVAARPARPMGHAARCRAHRTPDLPLPAISPYLNQFLQAACAQALEWLLPWRPQWLATSHPTDAPEAGFA